MKIIKRLISRNYTKGRRGRSIIGIIIHTEGLTKKITYRGDRDIYSYFNRNEQNPSLRTSAHYYVTLSGNILQYVNEEDTAYHAGNLEENYRTIGIEHQDDGYWDTGTRYTEAQIKATGELLRAISKRWGVPLKRGVNGIRGHNEIVRNRACPGKYPWLRSLELATTDDSFYRIVVDGVQEGAYLHKENAFDKWYFNRDKSVVTYKNTNITSEFINMATDLENKIEELKDENESLKETLSNMISIEKELELVATKYLETERENKALKEEIAYLKSVPQQKSLFFIIYEYAKKVFRGD